jgi:hypothetical protein
LKQPVADVDDIEQEMTELVRRHGMPT